MGVIGILAGLRSIIYIFTTCLCTLVLFVAFVLWLGSKILAGAYKVRIFYLLIPVANIMDL